MIAETLITAMFAFLRIGSFLFFLPMLDARFIPSMVKVIVAFGLALGMVPHLEVPELNHELDIIGHAIVNVVIGYTLAMIVGWIMAIPRIAGGLMDLDMGFAYSNLMNATSGDNSTVMQNLFNLMFILLFVALGGINQLILAIYRSFELTASLRYLGDAAFLEYAVGVFGYMMVMAVQIALPIMGSMFIVNFVLLIIGRTAKQMQVFQNMFAIKITAGIVMVMLSLPILADVMTTIINELTKEMVEAFGHIFERNQDS